ncbi:MAG: dihydroneopterin aldolase, partial [Actinomycetota bacterium]
LCESVSGVVSLERDDPLERLAARIAGVCEIDPWVWKVRGTVRKLRPPVPVALDHVAVSIER